jgi:hypothetical protein
MARRIRSTLLEHRTHRLALPVKRKPRSVAIAPGIALAYRRNKGPGVWSVKAAFGLQRFALADDFEDANGETVLTYWQALDRAKSLARAGEGNDGTPISVEAAIEAYALDLEMRGANKANAAMLRLHVPAALKSKPVALLSARDLRNWRAGLIKGGLKPGSADRIARTLKAALNLAASDDSRIQNAGAWTDLKRLPDADTARNILLSDETVGQIVRGCYDVVDHEFGVLMQALAEGGQRESQNFRLRVEDLQDHDPAAPRLMMPTSRKGRNRKIEYRPIPISQGLAVKLRQLAAGRAPHELLFKKRTWNLAAKLRIVTEKLGLSAEIVPYSFRHSSIVRMLLRNVPTRVVASHHDTSVRMLEAHYSRYILDPVDTMTRATLIDFDKTPEANVIPLKRK